MNWTISSAVNQAFEVEQTKIEFGQYDSNHKDCCTAYITNITDSSIGNGIVNFKYQGSEVLPLNNNSQELFRN